MMMRYTNLKKTLKRLIALMLAAFMLAGLARVKTILQEK